MKAQAVLPFILTLIPFLSGDQGILFSVFSSHFSAISEQTVVGRLYEDVILPCSFESGPEVVIHWKIQASRNVHTYYKGSDHLEKQGPRYANRTSLFHSEIHNGNASLSLRNLSLQDEGNYICYVGTASGKIANKVVLMVGAFLTPVMEYKKGDTESYLTCSVLSVYPRSTITWQVDNTPVLESIMEEMGVLPPFYNKSMLNITGSNASYQCVIENPLLEQTWTGRWMMGGHIYKMQSQDVSLSCQLENNFFLPNQDFIVTWSRVERWTSSVLAYFLSSSRNKIIEKPRFSWSNELINQSDFSLTLTDLNPSDNGEYLCNISSSDYTFLTVRTLHVERCVSTDEPGSSTDNEEESMSLQNVDQERK
ncbi:HERV-H LTR-associating protein 2 isoform X2 [Choloepus didactylus]|uniref:HERV-H LTR-associating protein 2 isoform X2 n=1 Tax=Choloepus didactylus TaxID=27675 RepID=UPI00189D0C3F|nr:HERV-H LTR-associating protein 2 isoform X2 [Choloepus didactylus]